jgi:hypothetical protein
MISFFSLPGVGRVLALTILMETGPIERFPKVGNYVSYCRYLQQGSAMRRRKEPTTGRTETSICHGPMQRRQNLRGVLTLGPDPITTGS